ncbi:hypothetical protein J7L06_06725 [Candidatus Bathyarchaeota archaeon]|nr:hypothetical protein [Candidatus Bathyarchaeota archaeon]
MRLHRSVLALFLLIALLQFPVEGTDISPSTTVASTSSTQASDLLNELGDLEVLGFVYHFDSRV